MNEAGRQQLVAYLGHEERTVAGLFNQFGAGQPAVAVNQLHKLDKSRVGSPQAHPSKEPSSSHSKLRGQEQTEQSADAKSHDQPSAAGDVLSQNDDTQNH